MDVWLWVWRQGIEWDASWGLATGAFASFLRGAQGSRRNGLLLLQPFTLSEEELGRDDGLDGFVKKVDDVGDRGEVGDVGELGGMGAFLGDSYEVLTDGGVDCSIVRIDALSSSSIPYNVVRSEYEFRIEFTRVILLRIVSASELLELIVDIVRSDAILEALVESEYEDAAMPMSCLCAAQWISGIDVSLKRISKIFLRTSCAAGRTMGALLSILRVMLRI
jgi:hypothetical protein